MNDKLVDTYIYLAKRDKRGIRLITHFKSQTHIPERYSSFFKIPFDLNVLNRIEQIIYNNRLEWEPWIESANNYDDLKTKLIKRGYSGLPMRAQPEVSSNVVYINRSMNTKIMIQKLS